MSTKLEEQKKQIEELKQKLQIREKLIKEKEQQKKFKRFSEIVRLAFQAKLDSLEDTVILGAFLEVAEKMNDPDKLQVWKKNGELHFNQNNNDLKMKLAISFSSDPGEEIKSKLKEMKFQWKSFKREFWGYGDRDEVENLLKGTDCQIEIIK